jgi:hypothetical protein
MINRIFIIILIFLSIYCEHEKLDDNKDKSNINENNIEEDTKGEIIYIDAKIDEAFTLSSNYTVLIESDNIEIHCPGFSDSRCPPDVTCIWEGEVAVLLDIKVEQIYNESIYLSYNNIKEEFNQFTIELIDLNYPFIMNDGYTQRSYSARLIISKNENL